MAPTHPRLPLSAYWQVCADKVIGSTHRRQKKPCQDDFRYDDSHARVHLLALADGHGSEKSSKSEFGAELAVRRAVEHLREFALGTEGQPLDAIRRYAEDELPRRLVKGWIESVKMREPDRTDVPKLLLEYGATLLAVMVTPHYLLYLQLGDGDILRVSPDHTVSRPIPKNPRLFANETTSLSMIDKRTGQPNGWLDMSVVIEPLSEPADGPALIVISTDGYANSFSAEAGFLQVGSDLLRTIQQIGWVKVRQEIPRWLEEATATGSGDDITLGLMWNRLTSTP